MEKTKWLWGVLLCWCDTNENEKWWIETGNEGEREADEPLFSPIYLSYVPILIIDLCLISYHFVNFTVCALLGQKFVIFINSLFLELIFVIIIFQGNFRILLGLELILKL